MSRNEAYRSKAFERVRRVLSVQWYLIGLSGKAKCCKVQGPMRQLSKHCWTWHSWLNWQWLFGWVDFFLRDHFHELFRHDISPCSFASACDRIRTYLELQRQNTPDQSRLEEVSITWWKASIIFGHRFRHLFSWSLPRSLLEYKGEIWSSEGFPVEIKVRNPSGLLVSNAKSYNGPSILYSSQNRC